MRQLICAFLLPRRQIFLRYLVLWGFVFWYALLSGRVRAVNIPITAGSPQWLGGFRGGNDERKDVDSFPAVAYDPTTERYLVVWSSPRNAGSQNDGLDVYGIFLDKFGRRIGSEFRISDRNYVARNGPPALVASPGGEFAVAWTIRGRPCRVAVELVVSPTNKPDKILVTNTADSHSPSLVYNPRNKNFMIAYVSGEDYKPPKIFGSDTADCGNRSDSTSQIRLARFTFINDLPTLNADVQLTGNHGAFRPRAALDNNLEQLLVVWEDRRDDLNQPDRFDVYGQRLSTNLSLNGNNFSLSEGTNYFGEDDSANWTPRPAVSRGHQGFMVAWFEHRPDGEYHDWAILASRVPDNGLLASPKIVARTSYVETHVGREPTGTVDIAYNRAAGEYLVAFAMYTESVWGYLSSIFVQRLDETGQLLAFDGTDQQDPGVGRAVDYSLDDQIFVSLATNTSFGLNLSNHMVVYTKR